jgi:hypothetical protein
MRRKDTSAGDYDIYIYGASTLACAAGLGRNGDFHYWDGEFRSTGTAWQVDRWYFVSILFDALTDSFDFVVLGEDLTEVMRIEGLLFAGDVSSIDEILFYTSVGYVGECFVDDFRLGGWCGSDPVISLGGEETGGVTAVEEAPRPESHILYQNHPNPFNPVTEIRYFIPEGCHVELEVFDILGRRIAKLLAETQDAGEKTVLWNGKDQRGKRVVSGIYFYRLRAGTFTETRKMILLR